MNYEKKEKALRLLNSCFLNGSEGAVKGTGKVSAYRYSRGAANIPLIVVYRSLRLLTRSYKY